MNIDPVYASVARKLKHLPTRYLAKTIIGIAIAGLASGCVATSTVSTSKAQPPKAAATFAAASDTSLEGYKPVSEPSGFVLLCVQFPQQCKVSSSSITPVTLDQKTAELLQTTNAFVNATIRPEDDQTHYGRKEYWTIPADGFGDCDDYAVTKRKYLMDAGLPAQALRIAIVVTLDGNRHAVLTVTTDKGDLVLDNLTSDIRPWYQLRYTWLERQDVRVPSGWVSLQPDRITEDLPTAVAERPAGRDTTSGTVSIGAPAIAPPPIHATPGAEELLNFKDW